MSKRILKSDLIKENKELKKENEELKNKLKEILKKEYDKIINVDYDDEFDAFLDDDIFNNIINKYNVSFKYLETYKYKGEKLNFIEYDFEIYKLKFNDEYKKYNMLNVIEHLLDNYYSYDYKDMMDKEETLIMIEKEKNKEYFLIIQKDPFIDCDYDDFLY